MEESARVDKLDDVGELSDEDHDVVGEPGFAIENQVAEGSRLDVFEDHVGGFAFVAGFDKAHDVGMLLRAVQACDDFAAVEESFFGGAVARGGGVQNANDITGFLAVEGHV